DLYLFQFSSGWDSVVTNRLAAHGERMRYLVFHKNSAYGYGFDSAKNAGAPRRLDVDSVLRNEFPNTVESMFRMNKLTLKSTRRDKKQGIVVQTYNSESRDSSVTGAAVVYFYFTEKWK